MADDDEKVAFYTRVQPFGALQALYRYLGPAAENLFHTAKQAQDAKTLSY